jgi:hypothetical protein
MFKEIRQIFFCAVITSISLTVFAQSTSDIYGEARLLNQKDDGYRGIWYMNEPLDNEYKFKYSGGLGTYPANHYPFSVHVPEVNKTFFCYGGTDESNSTLLHEVSFFDHATGEVPRPTIVLDKATTDAHDNPVMQVDKEGYIWIFSTSHGTGRPSFIHRSTAPYNIEKFERIPATKIVNGNEVPMDNFSYLQIYYDNGYGFFGLFTHYENKALLLGKTNVRVISWMSSPDGIHWSEWKDLASIDEGSYQSSGHMGNRFGTSFNYHPHRKEKRGLNYRTNLYCLLTDDYGKTWKAADGTPIELPLTTISNGALVHDYSAEGLNVYISDLNFDKKGNPVILYLTSKGPYSGPEHGPRQWYTAHWAGQEWQVNPVTTSGNNYDAGSIYTGSNKWRIVGSIETGPQPYNTGGEVAMWVSGNAGKSWKKSKQLTSNSEFNHAYVRRPVNAHPGFYGFWADGHARQLSKSRLYFSDMKGNVYKLPEKMNSDYAKPLLIK